MPLAFCTSFRIHYDENNILFDNILDGHINFVSLQFTIRSNNFCIFVPSAETKLFAKFHFHIKTQQLQNLNPHEELLTRNLNNVPFVLGAQTTYCTFHTINESSISMEPAQSPYNTETLRSMTTSTRRPRRAALLQQALCCASNKREGLLQRCCGRREQSYIIRHRGEEDAS